MEKIKAYFDGACHFCTYEARLIRRRDIHHRIEMINIADPKFKELKQPDRPYQRYMQVQKADGSFVQGVSALAEIYLAIPRYHWLGRALKLPVIHQLAWVFYFVFARTRKLLPQRKSCEL